MAEEAPQGQGAVLGATELQEFAEGVLDGSIAIMYEDDEQAADLNATVRDTDSDDDDEDEDDEGAGAGEGAGASSRKKKKLKKYKRGKKKMYETVEGGRFVGSSHGSVISLDCAVASV